MLLSEIEYPLRLCVEMLRYSAFADVTGDMKPSEIKAALAVFFPAEMIDKAAQILCGD